MLARKIEMEKKKQNVLSTNHCMKAEISKNAVVSLNFIFFCTNSITIINGRNLHQHSLRSPISQAVDSELHWRSTTLDSTF